MAVLFQITFCQSADKRDEVGYSRENEMPEPWEKAKDSAELALSDGVKFDMRLRVLRDVPVGFERRE